MYPNRQSTLWLAFFCKSKMLTFPIVKIIVKFRILYSCITPNNKLGSFLNKCVTLNLTFNHFDQF